MITLLTYHLSGKTIQIPLADGGVVQWFSDTGFKHVTSLIRWEAGWRLTTLILLFFSGSSSFCGQLFWGDLAVGAELPLSSRLLPCSLSSPKALNFRLEQVRAR